MIVPITSEAEWMPTLANAPSWEPARAESVWIIAPHPDDETLGTGGLIARLTSRGVAVSVIAVTDGEHAYAENTGLAACRLVEQQAALAQLGVSPDKIHRLHVVDSDVSTHEAELQSCLRQLIPSRALVVAPWPGDFHPDHEACGRAAAAAAQDAGAQCLFYFFWTWHRGTPPGLQGQDLCVLTLSAGEQAAKLAALAEHRSQLNVWHDEPPILPENLLWPARNGLEVFLR